MGVTGANKVVKHLHKWSIMVGTCMILYQLSHDMLCSLLSFICSSQGDHKRG